MIQLTREDAAMIIDGDLDDWATIETKIVDHSRWSVISEGIFEHIPSGKFYSLSWSVGATESQDESPFEYEDPTPIEVKAIQRLVNVWEPV